MDAYLVDAVRTDDGRVYVASATIDGAVFQRPCFVNFRTSDEDALALVEVVRELGNR